MNNFIWQQNNWPQFTWESAPLLHPLGRCRQMQGELAGLVEGVGLSSSREAQAEAMIQEAVKTSEIENVVVDPKSVRSSVARRLGLPYAGLPEPDRHIEGLVSILMDTATNYDAPLTEERLFGWHAALFPIGYSGLKKIHVAQWRPVDLHMRVVSGAIGKAYVHFEAPAGDRVPQEMKNFFAWWQQTGASLRQNARAQQEGPNTEQKIQNTPQQMPPAQGELQNNTPPPEGILRAGLAHLYFVTIHPFEDGNGRITRAISDMALSQDASPNTRYYSLSAQLRLERSEYYAALEHAQQGSLDVTEWLVWYLGALSRALERAKENVQKSLNVQRFWQNFTDKEFNARQKKVLSKLLEAGPEGFEGGLSNKKYRAMTKASYATATRDLAQLAEWGVLHRTGEGRSVRYEIRNSCKSKVDEQESFT